MDSFSDRDSGSIKQERATEPSPITTLSDDTKSNISIIEPLEPPEDVDETTKWDGIKRLTTPDRISWVDAAEDARSVSEDFGQDAVSSSGLTVALQRAHINNDDYDVNTIDDIEDCIIGKNCCPQFIPHEFYFEENGVDLRSIEIPSPDKRYTYLSRKTSIFSPNDRAPYLDSLIVAISATYHSYPDPSPESFRAAFGVYHGRKSRRNKYARLAADRSVRRAELMACAFALKDALDIQVNEFDGDLRRVVVKTGSGYLVKAMTEWRGMWVLNGFTDEMGWSVPNADLLRYLDHLVMMLNGWKTEVSFWMVPYGFNDQAEWLAGQALRSEYYL